MSDNDKVNTGHHIEDKELIKNARKPVGELGHQILDRMNNLMNQWPNGVLLILKSERTAKYWILGVVVEEILKDSPTRYPTMAGLSELITLM